MFKHQLVRTYKHTFKNKHVFIKHLVPKKLYDQTQHLVKIMSRGVCNDKPEVHIKNIRQSTSK